jgi:hypothetical protein
MRLRRRKKPSSAFLRQPGAIYRDFHTPVCGLVSPPQLRYHPPAPVLLEPGQGGGPNAFRQGEKGGFMVTLPPHFALSRGRSALHEKRPDGNKSP